MRLDLGAFENEVETRSQFPLRGTTRTSSSFSNAPQGKTEQRCGTHPRQQPRILTRRIEFAPESCPERTAKNVSNSQPASGPRYFQHRVLRIRKENTTEGKSSSTGRNPTPESPLSTQKRPNSKRQNCESKPPSPHSKPLLRHPKRQFCEPKHQNCESKLPTPHPKPLLRHSKRQFCEPKRQTCESKPPTPHPKPLLRHSKRQFCEPKLPS